MKNDMRTMNLAVLEKKQDAPQVRGNVAMAFTVPNWMYENVERGRRDAYNRLVLAEDWDDLDVLSMSPDSSE